ncbi:unnamed protein product, partial [Aureobasidium uvarum]
SRQHASHVHSRQPGQACLHLEEGQRRRSHKVRTPCSLLARRQVLETPRHPQEALRPPHHSAEGPQGSRPI